VVTPCGSAAALAVDKPREPANDGASVAGVGVT